MAPRDQGRRTQRAEAYFRQGPSPPRGGGEPGSSGRAWTEDCRARAVHARENLLGPRLDLLEMNLAFGSHLEPTRDRVGGVVMLGHVCSEAIARPRQLDARTTPELRRSAAARVYGVGVSWELARRQLDRLLPARRAERVTRSGGGLAGAGRNASAQVREGERRPSVSAVCRPEQSEECLVLVMGNSCPAQIAQPI